MQQCVLYFFDGYYFIFVIVWLLFEGGYYLRRHLFLQKTRSWIQEVFQLSITPAIGSPAFTCTEANGCFQQLEIVIVDDDGKLGKFLDFLFCMFLSSAD